MAKISNHSDRVLHPVYFTESGGKRQPNYVHLPDMKVPGVPPAVEDRAGLINHNGLPLKGPAIEYELPDSVAQNILDNGKNEALLASGLRISGVTKSLDSEAKSKRSKKD